MEIKGKTALITGAAGDLGSAVVHALLSAGAAQVVALDINQEKLAALQDSRIAAVHCDVSRFEAVSECLQSVYARHPAIDILINNAGILHSAPLASLLEKNTDYLQKAAADWQRCVEVNLSSVFYVSQVVAHHMLKARTKGVIINISSVSAKGNAGQSAYSASKAGVNALTGVWAKELAGFGIRTVAIAPGYIDLPSTRKAVPEAQLQAITGRVPLKKLGSAENILQAVRFAIENDYVNGTVIEVDGGLIV